MRTIVCLVAAVCALTGVATTASAGSASSCGQTNLTFEQASRDGALPVIYAALHGGATPRTSLTCSQSRR